jgi:hypothetical protein
MIASFGNLTLVSRVKFPKLAIMARGSPTCWAGGSDLAGWRRIDAMTNRLTHQHWRPTMPNTSSRLTLYQQALKPHACVSLLAILGSTGTSRPTATTQRRP